MTALAAAQPVTSPPVLGPRELLATAVRLRLALLRGALRSGPGARTRQLGTVLSAVLAALAGLVVLLGLLALHGRQQGSDLAVLLFTAQLVGWVALPVLTFTSDDTLDPARLALLPLRTRDVLVLHGVGALVGVASLGTLLADLGLVLTSADHVRSAAVALVAVPLQLVLCVVASRTAASALSGLLRSRRGRDLGVGLAALVAVSAQLVNPALSGSRGDGHASHRAAELAQWSPPGLLAAAPRLAVAHGLPAAVGALLVSAAVLALLAAAWVRSLARSTETVDTSAAGGRDRTDLVPSRLARVLPRGRTGAVAAKDLRYLSREPRRLLSVLTGVLLPVVVVIVGPALRGDGGLRSSSVFVLAGIGGLVGFSTSNRFGADGTSVWLLLSTSTHPRDARRDLLGGDLAAALVTFPLMVVIGVVVGVLSGGLHRLPGALGLGIALLLLAGGTSSVLSVFAPFPVPDSRNTFSNGGGQGFGIVLLNVLALVVDVVLVVPVLVLLVLAPGGVVLLAGPAYGLAVGAAVRELAVRGWRRRGPEVLQLLQAART